jgi:predicted dehydrogenase
MEDNDRKLRLAVVGCGAVAAIHHLPALSLSRSAEAVVLVDADIGRARNLAARFGVPETATDIRSLPGRVDAAIVALPNSLHAPVSIELLRQGVHVLVEKPMALNVRECDEIIAAAEASGAVLAVGLEFRFFDFTLLVRNLLREGLLGKIRRFEMHLGVIPRWPFATDFLLKKETAGGGVLADLGVHVLDVLLWWLGDWADVEYRDDAQGGLESDCELLLGLRSGVSGTVEISRTHNLSNTCLFEGERANLEVGIWDPDPQIRLLLEDREVDLSGRARRQEGSAITFLDAFVRQIDDFAAAVRDRREPRVPGREGRRIQTLIEACYARRKFLEMPWSIVPSPRERVS